MPTGTVIRFDKRRGYGFIQPDDHGEDVFVHQNNIIMDGFRYLEAGERVQFEMEVGEKGMKAVSVMLTEPRKPRAEGEHRHGHGEERAPRREFRPREALPPRAAASASGDERTRRKLERLISLLVEKGILAPGEIDGLESGAPAASAGNGSAAAEVKA
ncbi:MAG: cold shock domain-containing protein [Planctomycetota bacterium]|nr:cold shock domain-containing protein [Planctomycetota bacterium]MCX8039832.1 cold shock domain-containing protein [Planctomycetota bacterium]MDW8372837.1 cold shock domain-containing protein [Planctomycetota bacterium]